MMERVEQGGLQKTHESGLHKGGVRKRFKSKAQQRFLYSQEPAVAQEFAAKTPKSAYKELPEKVGKLQTSCGSSARVSKSGSNEPFF
jgi:hypothetical protein